MPFEVRYAPNTDFNIADAYFDALKNQRQQQLQRERRDEELDIRRQQVGAADNRAAARLRFDQEQANLRQLAVEGKRRDDQNDADSIMQAYTGALDNAEPSDDELAAQRLQQDLFGVADRPIVDQEESGFIDTPYGVRVPIVRPRHPAGARILLDAMNDQLDRQAKQEADAKKAEEAETARRVKRQRAVTLQNMTGIGLPTSGRSRQATPAEGGMLLNDPTVTEPGDPGMEFDDPADVLAIARLKQGQDRITIAQQRLEAIERKRAAGENISPEDLEQAAADLMTIKPDLKPTQALALARSRIAKIPVSMENIKAKGPMDSEEYKQLVHDRNETYKAIRRKQSGSFLTDPEREDLARLQKELEAMDAQLKQFRSAAPASPAGGKDDRSSLIQELDDEL